MSRWLAPPSLQDEDRQAMAAFLRRFLLSLILMGLLMVVPLTFFADEPWRSVAMMGLMVAMSLGQLALLARGHLRLVSATLVSSFWIFITVMTATDNGVHSPDAIGYVVVVLLAAYLLGEGWGLVAAAACMASLLAMVLAENLGWLPVAPPEPFSQWSNLVVYSFFILLSGLLQTALTRMIKRSLASRQAMLESRVAAEKALRETEERLRQSQKLESIGRLAGGVAHDFNNLLQIITGNVALARMDLPPATQDSARLREIDQAAQSAAALTKQLLAFSRRQLVQPRILDLNESVASVRAMLDRLLGEDIRIIVETEPGLGRVSADPNQVEQMLLNLAANARDAMPAGGTLLLETGNVRLGEDYCRQHGEGLVPGDYVRLAVTDSGAGMDTETLEHAFEPFFTTKASGQGTGLGLAMVYGAMKQNRGAAEVYSEAGKGSTFKLYFPRADGSPEEAPGPAPGKDLPGGGETLLLVEDSAGVRAVSAGILRRCGYQVLACGSAEEALEAAAAHTAPVDALVTDVVLPGMNGRSLAARLRAERPGLAVLYTSGYTENVIAHHGILQPDIDFLGKPYSPLDLADRVRAILDRVRPSSTGRDM